MDDFQSIPADKIPELRKTLEATKLPKQPERSEKDSMEKPPYLEIPVSARLVVAEKVYRTLGLTSDEFWNHFYRVVAYHADDPVVADEARKKSITLTEKMLGDKSNGGRRKELLYILGAMRHFTRDDAGAMSSFDEAAKIRFQNKDFKTEQNNNYDEYLSKLIQEYTEMIRKGEGPRVP
jgi:hypothetical protein